MNAPYFSQGAFGDEMSLIVAFVIGVGFGVCLEQAGFGSARKLTAQFYFRDLSVLKVMFTAIVTAMTGLYWVSRLGWVDLSLVHLTPTVLVPQLLGGTLLGVGFVLGGYCPGTSVVSAATGRIDAVVYLLGMLLGLFGFGEVYPYVAQWTGVTDFGVQTLPTVSGLPYGVVVLAVVLMALGAFVAAEWAEGKWGGKMAGADSLLGAARPLNAARGLAAVLLVGGLVAAVAGDPYRAPAKGPAAGTRPAAAEFAPPTSTPAPTPAVPGGVAAPASGAGLPSAVTTPAPASSNEGPAIAPTTPRPPPASGSSKKKRTGC